MDVRSGQEALIQWIASGIRLGIIPIIENKIYEGDLKYILSNMIAKISLSNTTYHISESAISRIDPDQTYTRASLYGKSNPLQLVYEHAIPCKVILNRLKAEYRLHQDHGNFESILSDVGPVVILTRQENNHLNQYYKSSMPEDWQWGESFFARYEAVGIPMSSHTIKMKGAIKR